MSSGVPYGAVGTVDVLPYVTNPGYITPQGGTSETYYYTAQGAQLKELRYSWFRNLEMPWSTTNQAVALGIGSVPVAEFSSKRDSRPLGHAPASIPP